MIYKEDIFEMCFIGDRTIVVKGVAKLFYQDGFPLSIAIDEFKKRNIEVSLLHVADQCWINGWSPKTILTKLKGECDIDINKSMEGVNWEELERFCHLIDQPQRSNGGYEESREMIFKYLYGCDYSDKTNVEPLNWLSKIGQTQ